jgi:hypothetical protein
MKKLDLDDVKKTYETTKNRLENAGNHEYLTLDFCSAKLYTSRLFREYSVLINC